MQTISAYRPALSQEELEDLTAQLAFFARHGFAFGVHTGGETGSATGLSRAWLSSTRFARTLVGTEFYATSFIIAPVYDEAGAIVFGIAVAGFQHLMAGSEIETLGKRLISTCQRLSYMISGTRDQVTKISGL